MFFYKVEGHMSKLSSFGRGKTIRPKKSLTSLLHAALQLKEPLMKCDYSNQDHPTKFHANLQVKTLDVRGWLMAIFFTFCHKFDKSRSKELAHA